MADYHIRSAGYILVVPGDGPTYPLTPRLDLVNHSPTGFSWGYHGSGCAQTAIAILSDHLRCDDARALMIYQKFKDDVIAGLVQRVPAIITGVAIDEWLAAQGAEDD